MAYDVPHGKLTTMEEDFAEIGLLHEEGGAKGRPPGLDKEEPAPGKSKGKEKKKVPETDLKKEDGEVDPEWLLALEARIIRLKTHTPAGKKAAKRAQVHYKKNRSVLKAKAKKNAHSSKGKMVRIKHRKVISKMGGTKKGQRVYTMGLDRISNMIEDVQDLVTGIHAKDFTETVKGYANIAIIAETLAGIFSSISEDVESRRLSHACLEMAELCTGLAEESAESAEALEDIRKDRQELRDLDKDAVDEHFRGQMSALLDGLEFYDNLMAEDGAESEHGDRDNDLDTDGAGAEGEHGQDAEEDKEDDEDDKEDKSKKDDEEEAKDDEDDDSSKKDDEEEAKDDEEEKDGDDDEDDKEDKKDGKDGKKNLPPWLKK